MKLIDADELRKHMYHLAFETDSNMQKWDGGCWIRYMMFEKAIYNAPAIEPTRWIPVTERLPEKSGRYLVTLEDLGEREVDWNIWYPTPGTGWLWEQRITAWMPLPEPWEGEGDED